ncbi:MAG: hypothetical protein KKH08_03575 [Candidatus Omnitrophica bacterium]|nr:hypothetical protein [Candidatus Omnitrophota bacterium]
MAESTPEEKLLNVIKKAQGKMKLKKDLSIFMKVNFVLVSLICVILVVFLVDLFSPKKKDVDLDIDIPEQLILPKTADLITQEIPLTKELPEPLSGTEIVKDLSLLGVVTGEYDQAIIEDKKADKTLFLYKGDTLREFKVYDIKEGIVTLDYKGEKIDLRI